MFEIRHNLALCLSFLKEYDLAERYINKALNFLSADKKESDYNFIKLQTILVDIEVEKESINVEF